jgi:energy-coupling factor transporter ATP-binding protein EcfA2
LSEPVVEVRGLVFVFSNGVRALDGIDLRIDQGERLAIIGQNGSGKSTLVRHFVGLLRATSGEVRVAGEPVGKRHVAELARVVAIAFQNPDRQIFAARVRDEVAFGPRNLGLRGPALDERVTAALAAVGLERWRDANPYDLGYSRRKLLALASVLAMGAPMVVLDEPTTGQDARGVRLVEAIVADLSARGTTVVVISHDMRFVAEAASRIVVMRAGRVVGDGSPEAIFSEDRWPTLRSTYLEPPLAARVGARLGLGDTPTEEALVARARAWQEGELSESD